MISEPSSGSPPTRRVPAVSSSTQPCGHDLVDRGFDRSHIVWFYKLDLDPAVSTPWWRFDYVVRSNLMAGNLDWLPRSRAVFDHSRIVAVFTTKDERIEIRRVVKPVARVQR